MPNLDVSTIVFAVVAIFVVFKLRSVLGTRTGAERPPVEPPPPGPPRANIVAFNRSPATPAADRWKGVAAPGTPLAAGLDAIAVRESGFDPAHFLTGARGAYEMIVAAFAAGDLTTLRRLLSAEVLSNFARAIEARQAAGQTMTTTLVAIDSADLVDARVTGSTASLAVKFATKLTSATVDRAGAVVEGSPTPVADHQEIWTFARELGARDPNWLLAATESAP
jgi:predicted lipid-binding transport protein (Tim44 family)